MKAYLVGGGIASLASAAYLIRDGGLLGPDIHVFEESGVMGGSLDGAGAPQDGYVIRGGRMFNLEAYTCTYDLLSFIPSPRDGSITVREEIARFNALHRTRSKSRLVEHGRKIDASRLGLGARQRWELARMMTRSEASLDGLRIDECFGPAFFHTNFWAMWCTMFAFQPWHSAVEMKRYLHRFLHELPRIHTLAGVDRTPYNQYDSIVRPLIEWLRAQGVQFHLGCAVTDVDFKLGRHGKSAVAIHYTQGGEAQRVDVSEHDLVFLTLGSMTAAATLGSTTEPAKMAEKTTDGTWRLWERLAAKAPELGNPSAFSDHVDESKWLSFTATFRDPTFFRLMEAFTGNAAGTGGLVTLKDSRWLMSVVLPHQPHFVNQPSDVQVCWGYGLFVDERGNFVDKPMAECSGAELLTELCSHLGFRDELPKILEGTTCVPCMMPFITSQFLVRRRGDRPPVRPHGMTNVAVIGQYCELPDDVVFTVEYSVRSAQTAVYALRGLSDKEVSPLYLGQRDPRVVFAGVQTTFH